MNAHDVVVTEAGESCGGVVYWTLSGECSAVALAQAWAAEGLDPDHLPKPASAETALRRAAHDLRDRHHIVRRLPDGTGYALVAAHEVDGKQESYATTLRVWLDAGQLVIEPAGHPDAERVIDAYERALSALDANDASALLVRTCDRLRAVGLRTHGGLYFVPAPQMPELERVARALEACSGHRVWKLPAMRSADAARAVLAAIAEEAEAEAAKMEEELSREGDDALGGRALEGRTARTDALRGKVAEYEQLMGGSLDSVRDRLEKLQAALAAASLAAMSDDSKEAA